MKTQRIILSLLFAAGCVWPVMAQKDQNQVIINSFERGIEYSIKAGFNIGGTTPLPLPDEIRKINSYSPGLPIGIEGNVTKWINPKRLWGITVGLRLESKGMTTKATVKNYNMKIINTNGGELEGLWTGGVRTKVNNTYLTVPVLVNYQLSSRWKLVLGPYVSYVISKDFSGDVYEGHLRTPDATGSKVTFSGESVATYDFSDELRNFQWGLQFGGEWRAFSHLTVHADLTWGLNNIFNSDFDTITFSLYPVYLNLGFGYVF